MATKVMTLITTEQTNRYQELLGKPLNAAKSTALDLVFILTD